MVMINRRKYVIYVYIYMLIKEPFVIYGIVLDQFYFPFMHVLVFPFQVCISHTHIVSGIYIYIFISVISITLF